MANNPDIVFETKTTLAFISLRHHKGSGPTVLVAPKKHVENLYDIERTTLSEVMELSQMVALAMKSCWAIDGLTLWQNNEPSGSQDVWHFHLHVKGRIKNDNLYNSKHVVTDQQQRQEWAKTLRTYLNGSLAKTLSHTLS